MAVFEDLFGKKVAAPEIPYRPLSEQEQRVLGDYANKLPTLDAQDAFWQRTREAALERIARIREGEFVVSEPREFGCSSEGYGEHVHIYPAGTDVSKFRGGYDRAHVIGSLEIWETGGFIQEPLSVWYQPDEGGIAQIKEALGFRAFLAKRGIPFTESGANPVKIREETALAQEGIGAREYLLQQLLKR